MRLVTWNCRTGAFRRKAAPIAPMKPDILVVPECEKLDNELFLDGDVQPTFRERVAPPRWRRGIGIFSYTGVTLTPASAVEPRRLPPSYVVCIRYRGELAFVLRPPPDVGWSARAAISPLVDRPRLVRAFTGWPSH
jgi:hypothetical protein